MLKKLIKLICHINSKYFFKYSITISTFSLNKKCKNNNSDNIVIIFQGNINYINKLLLGIKYYRDSFPNAIIILSTWEGELRDSHESIANYCEIVYSKIPEEKGLLGVNMQIIGMRAAFKQIYDMRIKNPLVVKIRTDFFPFEPIKMIQYIESMEIFIGENRLWGVDIGTKKNIPFSFSDMIMIGRYEKMIEYWSECPLNFNNISF